MSIADDLKRDWGNPEIFGPWTKELEKYYVPFPPGWFKFYKSYWLITTNKPAAIDTLPGVNDIK